MPAPDPWFDRGTEPVRRVLLEPGVRWIEQHWDSPPPVRLLDYGCGDLLLGAMLGPGWIVDGYDPDPAARRAAGRRAATGSSGSVFAQPEDIPARTYDGVVLSSVVQYFDGPEEFVTVLGRVAAALHPDGRGILVTDLVVPGKHRLHDAWDLWRNMAPALGRVGTASHVLRSVRRSPGRLWGPRPDELVDLAAGAGLIARPLPRNLTPFDRRSSWLLFPGGG